MLLRHHPLSRSRIKFTSFRRAQPRELTLTVDIKRHAVCSKMRRDIASSHDSNRFFGLLLQYQSTDIECKPIASNINDRCRSELGDLKSPLRHPLGALYQDATTIVRCTDVTCTLFDHKTITYLRYITLPLITVGQMGCQWEASSAPGILKRRKVAFSTFTVNCKLAESRAEHLSLSLSAPGP